MALTIPPPKYDAVLRFYPYRIELAFAAKISPEIVRDIEGLANSAIEVKREKGSFSPPGYRGQLIGASGGDDFYRKKKTRNLRNSGLISWLCTNLANWRKRSQGA